MYSCGACPKSYRWPQDIKRHKQLKHRGLGPDEKEEYVPHQVGTGRMSHELDTNTIKSTKTSMVFFHPFTMTVSGPTSCGKTTLIKNILQRAQFLISPPPTRIIWLYKRWQPLYYELRKTVTPRIEFVQGIPLGLESDSFISTKENNLIILDDLMSTAGKNPIVTELFTEGSHHRNLSVIAINQNLYFSKDPTQRRNSNYMIVFNNPVDRQPMMTLA